MKWKPVIGMEVHVELKTDSKMFCACPADHFGKEPNTQTCPVCLGLPGALPVPNKKAIDWCILIGLALGCDIPLCSKFDRKNYFYPDLPKGYQISQYDEPFCQKGFLNINIGGKEQRIRITRVHMEEDTGKLLHKKIKGKNVSLIDFNRSGVPLVEIVSEPDITSSEEAVAYLKKLQQIVQYLGVSDCEMSEGTMRCEANISLQKVGAKELPSYKAEIKNLNSFKFVKDAIEYEIKRQAEILNKGKRPKQETRGFDPKKAKTFPQRIKEMANDYRYFPEPDIPPVEWSRKDIAQIKTQLPELPDERQERLIKEYKLREDYARILVSEKKTADYFENTAALLKKRAGKLSVKDIASAIVNKRFDIENLSPEKLIKIILCQKEEKIGSERELKKITGEVIKKNKKAVEDYKQGKEEALKFLLGQIMKETKGRADGEIARKILEKNLKKP